MKNFIAACFIVCSPIFLVAQSQDASALLAKVAAQARKASSLSASVLLTREAAGTGLKTTSGTFKVKKPNYAIIRLNGDDPPRVLASDGKTAFTFSDEATYTVSPVDPNGEKIDSPWWNLPLRFFFTQSINPFGPKPDAAEKVGSLPDEMIAGESFRVLSISGTQPLVYTGKLYVNRADVLSRTEVHFGPTTVFTAVLTDIKTDFPITVSSFRFAPSAQASLKTDAPVDKLLAIGQPAPDFHLPKPNGAMTTLATERSRAKATLVNFWYLNCPPCRIEFPDFEKLYEQFHSQGLNIVAIDKDDAPQDVAKYLARARLTFPVAMGGQEIKGSVFDRYHIEAFPATYLLDQEGKIVYRASAGVDATVLRAELAKLGLR